MAVISVNKLIERSYRVINKKSDDRNLSQTKINDGLEILNELLDSYFAEPYSIAYNNEVTFNLTVGQKSYEFSNEGTADVTSNKIAHLRKVNIISNNDRYPVSIKGDYIDWDRRRITDQSGRPLECYLQNANFKSFLIFNLLPNEAYECKVKAKFALSNVTLNTDLTEVPIYYTNYYILALAEQLHTLNPGSKWDTTIQSRLNKAEANVKSRSDKDLIQKTTTALTNNYEFDVDDDRW
jgi:hypothetical protein